jgi:hypothetical protein
MLFGLANSLSSRAEDMKDATNLSSFGIIIC